jgi:hypothetical protein
MKILDRCLLPAILILILGASVAAGQLVSERERISASKEAVIQK